MKTIFNASQFVATEWSTADDKAKFANHFIGFVESGFKSSKFPKWFYTRLAGCRGHIAHYNQSGFFHEWFSTPDSQIKFIQHWIESAIYGDPKFTYSDVERKLTAWLIDNHTALVKAGEKRLIAAIQAEVQLVKKEGERKATVGNTEEYLVLAKSRNTGSFGHKSYIFVNREGIAWSTQKIPSNGEWLINQVVSFNLDANKNPIFPNCECTRRLTDAPKENILKIWPKPTVDYSLPGNIAKALLS